MLNCTKILCWSKGSTSLHFFSPKILVTLNVSIDSGPYRLKPEEYTLVVWGLNKSTSTTRKTMNVVLCKDCDWGVLVKDSTHNCKLKMVTPLTPCPVIRTGSYISVSTRVSLLEVELTRTGVWSRRGTEKDRTYTGSVIPLLPTTRRCGDGVSGRVLLWGVLSDPVL